MQHQQTNTREAFGIIISLAIFDQILDELSPDVMARTWPGVESLRVLLLAYLDQVCEVSWCCWLLPLVGADQMISRALQGLWARSSPAIGYNMNMKSAEFVAKQDLLTDAIKKMLVIPLTNM